MSCQSAYCPYALEYGFQNKSIFLVSSLSSRNFPPNAEGRPRDHRESYVITFSS